MKIKKLAIILICIILVINISAPSNSLLGYWEKEPSNEYLPSTRGLYFKSNGTVESRAGGVSSANSYIAEYTVDGDKITIINGEYTYIYTFEIKDNVLTFTEDNGFETEYNYIGKNNDNAFQVEEFSSSLSQSVYEPVTIRLSPSSSTMYITVDDLWETGVSNSGDEAWGKNELVNIDLRHISGAESYNDLALLIKLSTSTREYYYGWTIFDTINGIECAYYRYNYSSVGRYKYYGIYLMALDSENNILAMDIGYETATKFTDDQWAHLLFLLKTIAYK